MPHLLELESIDPLFFFGPSLTSTCTTPQKRRHCAKHPIPSQHKPTTNKPTSPQHNSRAQKRVAVAAAAPKKTFTPSFDVIETSQSFILEGEFPGIKNKNDIVIEFDDEGRLVVKGDINTTTTSDKKAEIVAVPVAANEPEREGRKETKEQEKPTENPKKRRSLSPTVEEVPDDEDEDYSLVRTPSTSSTSTMEVENTASSSNQAIAPETKEPEKVDLTISEVASEKEEEVAEPPRKMLLQERRQTIGNFSRVFKFASPIEMDGVKAKLENGLLRIVVPKVVFRMRRIEVR